MPTSSESPIAATIAAIANSAVCNQKLSRYSGSAASRTTTAIAAPNLNTGDLPRPEQPGRPHQQHEQHHHVRRDAAKAAAQERQLLLVAGGEHRDDADDQAADDRTGGRVEAAE